jgi:hypothetical protein
LSRFRVTIATAMGVIENQYVVSSERSEGPGDTWVGQSGIRIQLHVAEYHAAGNLLVALFFAITGSMVATVFHDARERRREAQRSERSA